MRELWVVGGIVGIGVAAAITFAIYLINTGDDSPPLDDLRPTATATVFPSASRPIASPTASPTPAAPAYEPIAWDARDRVQRLPPPTEAAALAERAVHRNGFAFGAEPPSFEGVPGGDACGSLSVGVTRRAGDWIVSTTDATSGLRMGLVPRIGRPDGSEQLALPWVVRWRYLDDGPERTHVHEQFWSRLDGVFSFPLVLPAVGTWRAIATHGPNWGCFTLEVTDATPIPWRTADAEVLGGEYPTALPTAAEAVRFDESLARSRARGTAARQCVDASDALWVRSGEITTRIEQVQAAWSPTRRSSKVGFGVLGQHDLGELLVLGAASPLDTYSYVEPGPVQSATSSGEPLGVFGYVTSINPPSPGRWLLIASAAPTNWGCFTVELPATP